ncbi:hypothetical protein BB561_006135 [Smittium simulii]|uniref:Fork-head domain-containing protein n=1 Tax=Smittium simulii TaxID=133385 RepID=A0A2T9Y6C6_9FUNG|nr:hypothetical protein BB561_006135 [Smittium simulii]
MDSVNNLSKVSFMKNQQVLAAPFYNGYNGINQIDHNDIGVSQTIDFSVKNTPDSFPRTNIPGSLKRKVIDDFDVGNISNMIKNKGSVQSNKKQISDKGSSPQYGHSRASSNPCNILASKGCKTNSLVPICSSNASNDSSDKNVKPKIVNPRKSEPRSRTGSIDITLILDESAVLKDSKHGKLPHSYATIITYAILHHPNRKMSLSEIYSWVSENYPHVKNSGIGWKNSIRHNLSLNRIFTKMNKTEKKTGKGSYWSVDFNVLGEAITQGAKKRRISPEILFSTGLWSRLGLMQNADIANSAQIQHQKESLGQYLKETFLRPSKTLVPNDMLQSHKLNNNVSFTHNLPSNIYENTNGMSNIINSNITNQVLSNFTNQNVNFVDQFVNQNMNSNHFFNGENNFIFDNRANLGSFSNQRPDVIDDLCSSITMNSANMMPLDFMQDFRDPSGSLIGYNIYPNSNTEPKDYSIDRDYTNNQINSNNLKGIKSLMDSNSLIENNLNNMITENNHIRNDTQWGLFNDINNQQLLNQDSANFYNLLSHKKINNKSSITTSSNSSDKLDNLLLNFDLTALKKTEYMSPENCPNIYSNSQSKNLCNIVDNGNLSNGNNLNIMPGIHEPYF